MSPFCDDIMSLLRQYRPNLLNLINFENLGVDMQLPSGHHHRARTRSDTVCGGREKVEGKGKVGGEGLKGSYLYFFSSLRALLGDISMGCSSAGGLRTPFFHRAKIDAKRRHTVSFAYLLERNVSCLFANFACNLILLYCNLENYKLH